MKKIPRICRILVSLGALATACLAFGIYAKPLRWYIDLQFAPELLRGFALGSLAALGLVAAQLAIAWLFGRWYCAVICPFGVLQDLLGLFSRARNTVQPNYRKLRYVLAAIAIGLLAAGWAVGWERLDPYSNFGAIYAGIIDFVHYRSTPTLIWALVPLVILALLVVWKKRIYCTAICPAGTLLGLAAKHGLFRLKLDTESCVKCLRCVGKCPAGCIDPVNGALDNERCLRCMNCIAVCPKNSIRYRVPALQPVPVDPERRRMLTGGAATLVLAAGVGYGLKPTNPSSPLAPAKPVICPPGAGSTARFAARCTDCQLCVTNCLGKVLRCADADHPTIHLNFERGMCEFACNRCSQSCPTGALTPLTLPIKRRTRIGLAKYFPPLCVAVLKGTDCGACAEHCPTGALTMEPDPNGVPIPHLNDSLCIGCGSCEYACPMRPERAIQVFPVSVQVLAEDPKTYFERIRKEKERLKPASKEDEWLI